MSRRVRAFLILTGAVALLLIVSTNALAANTPDPKLDQVATEVAGHPVTAWCEDSQTDWKAMGIPAAGFTRPPGRVDYAPIVYISPEPCATLHKLLNGVYTDPGATAWGIVVLLHEASHQIGGQYAFDVPGEPAGQRLYEGRTDCHALALLPKYLSFFGINPTASTLEWMRVKHRQRVRRHGHWVWRTWTTLKAKRSIGPNPLWEDAIAEAQRRHDNLGRLDPAYKGNC
jgi:hypothetical protein